MRYLQKGTYTILPAKIARICFSHSVRSTEMSYTLKSADSQLVNDDCIEHHISRNVYFVTQTRQHHATYSIWLVMASIRIGTTTGRIYRLYISEPASKGQKPTRTSTRRPASRLREGLSN